MGGRAAQTSSTRSPLREHPGARGRVACSSCWLDFFGKGQIVSDGITNLGVDPDQFAVTGGTGTYAGAGAELVVTSLTRARRC